MKSKQSGQSNEAPGTRKTRRPGEREAAASRVEGDFGLYFIYI
ncbi:hypothetical protein [Sorangium sp. So ce590]